MTAGTLPPAAPPSLAWDSGGRPDGAPVVLLHALGTDRTIWDEVSARLSDTHRVVRVDLRGHGSSAPGSGPAVIDDEGGAVVGVLDALGIVRAHVAGISLGGLVAQWLGVHAPERVRTLTLANTAARLGAPELWNARIATVEAGGLAAVADVSLARWFSDGFRAAHAARVADCRRRLLATPAAGYLRACAILRDADLRADVARIRVPSLVIGGQRDVATPPSDSEWLARAIPGATLQILDAAHLSNVECPDAFVAAMRAVIDSEVRHG